MKIWGAIILAVCLGASVAAAHEEAPAGEAKEGEHAEGGEHGEHKAKPPEKPKPDSALSSVLELPVVKEWSQSVEAHGSDRHIVAWGESRGTIRQHECYAIAVGEDNGKEAHVWKRFCVGNLGDMWVEMKISENSDEHEYVEYEDWVKKCEPTAESSGKC